MSPDDDITRQERPADTSAGGGLALFTDLYQLTMLQAYFEERMTERAVFSLFVRRLPPRRNFLIACGLDIVLDYLESLRFTQQDLTYLDSLEIFSDRFLAWLTDFRFTGDIHATREGTPIFANEPILEVEAPLARGPAHRDLRDEPSPVADHVGIQGPPRGHGCPGPFCHRLRRAPDARDRRRPQRCARILDRRRQRHLQRPCGKAVRHSRGRHVGTQLHPGPRRRGRSLSRLRQPLS